MSTVQGGNRIVTDRLIAFFDASNPYSYTTPSSIINDISPSKLSGTLTSVTYDSANRGSLVFNGTSGIISSTTSINNRLLTSDGNVSMEVCFYANTALQSTMLFSYLQGSQSQYGIGLSQNGIFFTSPSSFVYNMGAGLILPNRWYSITLTCQQITSNSTLISRWISYINGNISITTAYNSLFNVGSVLNSNANQSFYIGRRGFSNDSYFNGKIGSIKVYNKTLSAAEVLQNFNATKGRFGL